MHKLVPLAVGLLVGSVPSAWAQATKDCGSGGVHERIQCLQENIKELAKEVASVRQDMPRLNEVVLQWRPDPPHGDNSCIAYMGGGALQLRDACNDPNKNRFTIRPYRP